MYLLAHPCVVYIILLSRPKFQNVIISASYIYSYFLHLYGYNISLHINLNFFQIFKHDVPCSAAIFYLFHIQIINGQIFLAF